MHERSRDLLWLWGALQGVCDTGAQATMQDAAAHRILARSRDGNVRLDAVDFLVEKTAGARRRIFVSFAGVLPWARMRAVVTINGTVMGRQSGRSASPCSRGRRGMSPVYEAQEGYSLR